MHEGVGFGEAAVLLVVGDVLHIRFNPVSTILQTQKVLIL